MRSTLEDFKRDLNQGRKAEELFQNYLIAEYKCRAELSPDKYFPAYDVSTTASTGNTIRYEVKSQGNYKSDKDFPNGTVFIETGEHKNDHVRPTALSLTKADYYGFVFEHTEAFFIIPVPTLKQMCTEIDPKHSKMILTNHGFEAVIFERSFFLSKCTLV